MYSLFDFITHVKGVEYVLSLLFIAGFILFIEILKPNPFQGLVEAGRDDVEYLKRQGAKSFMRSCLRVLTAPFIGLFYVMSLPVLFAYAVMKEVAGFAGSVLSGAFAHAERSFSFSWRPTEAYLSGKKEKSALKDDGEKKPDDEDEDSGQ